MLFQENSYQSLLCNGSIIKQNIKPSECTFNETKHSFECIRSGTFGKIIISHEKHALCTFLPTHISNVFFSLVSQVMLISCTLRQSKNSGACYHMQNI